MARLGSSPLDKEPAMFQRIANGWQLVQQSWRVLKLDKELLLFPLMFPRLLDRNIALIYTFILAYALPYTLVAVMSRYSAPITTLTSILIGLMVCKIFEMLPFHRLRSTYPPHP